jgi:ADP-heptose:LPS heptosyltransferase
MQHPEHHATLKVFLQRLQKVRDHIRRKVALFFYDRVRQPTSHQLTSPIKKQIVFVRWDAKLGDTIVTSWLFREIRKHDPSLQLVVIAPESFKSMFLNDMGADRVIVAPKRVTFSDVRRIAKDVGSSQYVMHMAEHLKPKDVYLLSKLDSNYVIGLDDGVKSINIKAGISTQGQHFADKVAVLMQHMGLNDFDQSYIVPFDAAAQARTDAWWPQRPVIAFNPLGRGHARQFSLNTAVVVVEHMLKSTRADVLILIDPAQRNFAEFIKQKINQTNNRLNNQSINQTKNITVSQASNQIDRIILPPAEISAHTLGDLFACVRRCQAMVSVDTATIHIATGLAKPVFGFYNPQQNEQDFSFVNWSPRSKQSVSQLAIRVNPQVVDAIDIDEFKNLFAQFVKDYDLNLMPQTSNPEP